LEFDVIGQLKSYWDKIVGLADEDEEEFVDATSECSVRASKFLEGLDLGPVMPELNRYYSVPEGKERYPRRAMFKCMIFRKIKGIKYYTKTENYLNDYPDEALELGFKVGRDGNVEVPDHETLRHFEKVRLGNEGMDGIMELLCVKVVEAGDKLGLSIGEKTGTDSTPIETPNGSCWNI